MGIFGKSKDEKRAERNLAYRKAMHQIENYLGKCEEIRRDYIEAGREAAKLGDDKMLQHYARGIVKLDQEIMGKRRMMLMFKGLKLEEGMAELSTSFVGSLRDLSTTIMEGVDPKRIAEAQGRLERALEQNQQVSETLSAAMATISEGILTGGVGESGKVEDIMEGLKGQASAERARDIPAPREKAERGERAEPRRERAERAPEPAAPAPKAVAKDDEDAKVNAEIAAMIERVEKKLKESK